MSPLGTKMLTGLGVLSPTAREGQGCSEGTASGTQCKGYPYVLTHSWSYKQLAEMVLHAAALTPASALPKRPQPATSTPTGTYCPDLPTCCPH